MKNPKQTVQGILHALIGLIVVVPVVVETADLDNTIPWIATAVAVSTAVSRVLAVPAVRNALPEWLRPAPEGPGGTNGLGGQSRTGTGEPPADTSKPPPPYDSP